VSQRSPRVVLLWLIAAALAIVTALSVAHTLADLHRQRVTLGPPVQVVVARHDLALGAIVRAADVTSRTAFARTRPVDALSVPNTVVGRTVLVPVLRSQPVTGRNLAPRTRTGLDGAIPPGTRAVHLLADDGLHPRAGAAVDVIVAFDPAHTASGGRATEVAAAGALVLSTDRPGSSTAQTPGGVTLLVTVAQASRLADAAANGTLMLALAPPDDLGEPG
jgi:Flp pilus assembly protein CpaB